MANLLRGGLGFVFPRRIYATPEHFGRRIRRRLLA